MKNKTNSLLALLGAVLVFVVVITFTSSGNGDKQPPFTVFNTNIDGTALLYDTLKTMGKPVKPYMSAVNQLTPLNDVVVMIEPAQTHFSESDMDELMAWVYGGGRLIFLSESDYFIEDYFEDYPYYEDDYIALYDHGMGEVLVGFSSDFTNQALIEDTTAGQVFADVLDTWAFDNILFNEAIHGFKRAPSFFRILPIELKMVFYQLVLVSLVVVWHLGKRFGKPIPYFEETQREENEYVKSLAVIFKNAGKGEVVIENHYDHFVHLSAAFFGNTPGFVRENMVQLWEEHDLPHLDRLVQLEAFVQTEQVCNTKKRRGRKQLMQQLANVKKLKNEVKFQTGFKV